MLTVIGFVDYNCHCCIARSEKVGRWADYGRSLGRGLTVLTLSNFGSLGCYPREMFENIGATWCILGDIRSSKAGRKIDAFMSHF